MFRNSLLQDMEADVYKLDMANSELHCLPGLYVYMRHSGQFVTMQKTNDEINLEIYPLEIYVFQTENL